MAANYHVTMATIESESYGWRRREAIEREGKGREGGTAVAKLLPLTTCQKVFYGHFNRYLKKDIDYVCELIIMWLLVVANK